MDKMQFDNAMARQARLAPGFVRTIVESMGYDKLNNALPLTEIWDAQQIVITGCGDSWLAGIAARPLFESVSGVKNVQVMRNIEFNRYMDKGQLGFSPNTPLVIGISISGTVSRVVEAMERAQHYGANSLLITDDPDSPAAKAARHVLLLDMPKPGEYGPGLLSYCASVSALMCLALRIGRARGFITDRAHKKMVQAIVDSAASYAPLIEEMDQRCFELAGTWKDLRCVDFVGDYADYATAFFGSAKILETYGGYTTYDDSEDWCHINYFLRDPDTIGRVFITNSDTPSFNRVKETLVAVDQLGSPCIVVTDADKSEFADRFEVFTTPKAPYSWLSPLMQHLPYDFISGYSAELLGVENFRRDNPVYVEQGGTRIRQSKITIV